MKSRIKKGLITYTLLSIDLYNVSCQCLKHRKNSYAEGKYQMICLTTIDDNVPHWTFSRDNYSKDTKIIDDESLEVIIRKEDFTRHQFYQDVFPLDTTAMYFPDMDHMYGPLYVILWDLLEHGRAEVLFQERRIDSIRHRFYSFLGSEQECLEFWDKNHNIWIPLLDRLIKMGE